MEREQHPARLDRGQPVARVRAAYRVEHHLKIADGVGGVGLRIVDDFVRAQRTDEVSL
jgi:hypothetical protein